MSFQAMSWAVKQTADPREKFLLIMMANYADDNGRCWPKYATLSKDTGFSRSTILRSIKDLQKLGFLKVHKRRVKDRQGSNLFVLSLK